ncbi:MAG: phenylacetate--CoA ligase family protein [bacterium]|nr:phenylacetate--CoA ligase family protein [bacterium]
MMYSSTLVSTLNKLRLLPITKRRLYMTPAKLESVQLRMLQRTLFDAYRHVPLYTEKFDKARFLPDDLRSLSDLARFPITEKDEVRDAFPNGCIRRGTDLAQCRIQQTSGSSGQCMEIALDRKSDDHRTLFTERVYRLQGFTFWRRAAYLFPYPLPLQKNLGLYRNKHISTESPPEQIVATLRDWRPHLLAATPSDLLDLCEKVDDDMTQLGIKAISVHSEPMSADEKAFVSGRFGCRITTNYYCNEAWAIGAECKSGSLHQFPDSTVVEIVDDRGHPMPRGQIGHVLVTSLHNYAQPFIRYRLGDMAAWDPSNEPCACGLVLPRLLALEGRDDDYIEYPDGRRVRPSNLTVAVKSPCFEYPGEQIFRDYRITQDSDRSVTVYLVPGRDREHFDECAKLGRANLATVLGEPFSVFLEVCDGLDRGTGGKRKIVERLFRREPNG